jgi:GNAT acetyltransferase
MIPVVRHVDALLAPVMDAETPGPDAIAAHVVATECGRAWVDRCPQARVLAVEVADNYLIRGDGEVACEAGLDEIVYGFVDAPPSFEPLLKSIADRFATWDRVILADPCPGAAPSQLALPSVPEAPPGCHLRRLESGDADALAALDPELTWIAKTWGGPSGLARSGMAWGAFVDGRLASVACTFFQGRRHEDIGVVTEREFRRRGLSAAAAARLCLDIRARGRRPTWSTSPDNAGSLKVARRLGFREVRRGVMYLVGIDPPD